MAKLGQHPNFIRYFDFHSFSYFDKNNGKMIYYLQVAMECADRSLENILKENKILPLETLLSLAIDCLSALKHISKQKMAHLDLKPANILYFNDKNEFKLVDWAGAIEAMKQSTKTRVSGKALLVTEKYSAPEILNPENHAELDFHKSDIYSLGLTLLECFGIKNEKRVPVKKKNMKYT